MKMYHKFLQAILFMSLIFTAMPVKLFSQTNSSVNQYRGLFLEINLNTGMFAVFGTILGALTLYDQGKIAGVHVNITDGIYSDQDRGPNWWEYFFEPIDLGNKHAPKHACVGIDSYTISPIGLSLNPEAAFYLIQKYVKIKPDIEKEVQTFVRQNFLNNFVIGVHHRGTDKVVESPLVSYEATVQFLNIMISTLSNEQKAKLRIYVATDDQHFLNYLASLYPSIVIYGNFVRSSDGTPLHYGATPYYATNYQKGKEALLDCLLLSRCQILIRPASSCLSRVSHFFNPYIPVIVL